ncbi:MAG: acyloxyacyl hydrolase [Cyclobacteriaceae bacterium]
MKIGWLFVLLLSLLASLVGHSQDSIKSKPSFSHGLFAHYGFIFAHSKNVENTDNSFPRGLTAAFNWQRTDKQVLDRYNCFPRQSLLVAFYDFDNSILGRGINLAYSLEPHFMINKYLSFYPKVSIGAAALSNPADSIKNPTNKSYSLPVSAYLALGVGLRWQFSNQWAININAEYQHVSNGGLREPNLGINWPTAGLGIEYSPKGLALKKYIRTKEDNKSHRALRIDVGVLGIVKGGNINSMRVYEPIVGMNFTTSKQVNLLHAWTASVEFYQDRFLVESLADEGVKSKGLRSGALIGHEFLLGKFIFSQQLGIYLVGQYNNDLLYHRWSLQYYFLPRWGAGVSLKAHKQVADFTDVRITYAFSKK